MDPRFFAARDRPVASPLPTIAGCYAVGLLTMALPEGWLRLAVGLPPIMWLFKFQWEHHGGKSGSDHSMGIQMFVFLLRWIDFAYLHTAERDFYRVDARGKAIETYEDIEKMTRWQKFKWNLSLLTSSRGIGWNWRVKNVEEIPPEMTRRGFVMMRLRQTAYRYLICDTLFYLTLWLDFESRGYDLYAQSRWDRARICWIQHVPRACQSVLLYDLLGALLVATGILEPFEWPTLIGDVSEAYTVRNFWGQTWHQLFRRQFETYGNMATTALGLKRGTMASKYTKLYLAFFISGVIHYVGTLNIPWHPAHRGHFWFFMVHAAIITVEDFFVWIGENMGIRKSWKTKALGFVWVSIMFSLSFPMFTEEFFYWKEMKQEPIYYSKLMEWSLTAQLLGPAR